MFKTTRVAFLSLLFFLVQCEKPHNFPWTFSEDPGGCLNFIVYQFTEDYSAALEIIVLKSELGLGMEPQEFDITPGNIGIDVGINVFDRPAFDYYCNDLGSAAEVDHRYEAMDGTITISLSSDTSSLYDVDIVLNDVAFELEQEHYTLDHLEILGVQVGWSAP